MPMKRQGEGPGERDCAKLPTRATPTPGSKYLHMLTAQVAMSHVLHHESFKGTYGKIVPECMVPVT